MLPAWRTGSELASWHLVLLTNILIPRIRKWIPRGIIIIGHVRHVVMVGVAGLRFLWNSEESLGIVGQMWARAEQKDPASE